MIKAMGNNKLNVGVKRVFILFGILVGLFVVSVVTVFILFQRGVLDGSGLSKSLITGGVVTGLYLPAIAWLFLRPIPLTQYSGFQLIEMELNEDELSEAVSLWVYINHKKRVEGRIQLLEDDTKTIRCRVAMRKE